MTQMNKNSLKIATILIVMLAISGTTAYVLLNNENKNKTNDIVYDMGEKVFHSGDSNSFNVSYNIDNIVTITIDNNTSDQKYNYVNNLWKSKYNITMEQSDNLSFESLSITSKLNDETMLLLDYGPNTGTYVPPTITYQMDVTNTSDVSTGHFEVEFATSHPITENTLTIDSAFSDIVMNMSDEHITTSVISFTFHDDSNDRKMTYHVTLTTVYDRVNSTIDETTQ